MTVGQRIAQKRKEQGLSQEALGEALGVSRQSVYKWESDSALPEIEKLVAMSRLFGVTVGWLLGVEEGTSGPETGKSDAGELTETQLKMVEEIVDRYLSAQQPPKKHRWPWVIAAVAAICLLGVLNSLRSDLRNMQSQYANLQNSVNNVTYSVDSQISGITSRVEEVLKNQNSLTASYGTEVVSADLAANTVTFSAYAAPKTYTEGMTAVFVTDDGEKTAEVSGTLGENQTFSAELICELTDEITISVVFITGDIRETQLLDTHYSLYSSSLPYVDYDYIDAIPAMMWKELNEAGELDWSNEYACRDRDREPKPTTSAVNDRIGRAEVKSLRIGLFRNQKLLGWLEPCEKPDTHHGYENCDFYRFPDVSVVPEAGDIFTVTAIVTDEYDREYAIKGIPYEMDFELGELVSSSTDNWIGLDDPANWEY